MTKQAWDNPKAFLALAGKIVPAEIVTDGAPVLLERIVLLALEGRDERVAPPAVIDATDYTETQDFVFGDENVPVEKDN